MACLTHKGSCTLMHRAIWAIFLCLAIAGVAYSNLYKSITGCDCTLVNLDTCICMNRYRITPLDTECLYPGMYIHTSTHVYTHICIFQCTAASCHWFVQAAVRNTYDRVWSCMALCTHVRELIRVRAFSHKWRPFWSVGNLWSTWAQKYGHFLCRTALCAYVHQP